MLGIDGGHAGVALNHAVAGRHLGALIVGDVALDFLAAAADPFFVLDQKVLDLAAGGLQRLDLLLFALPPRRLRGLPTIFFAVPLEQKAHRPVDLLCFLPQVLFGPAPLLGSVRGHLAAVDGKHLPAQQAHFAADQQHLAEQGGDLLGRVRNEGGNGGEVGPAVGRERHEDHVLATECFDLAATGDPPRIGQQHDLQQNRRIIGRATCFIVLELGVEDAQVEFVVDQEVDGVLEGAGENLVLKSHRQQHGLIVIVIDKAGHVPS